MTKRIAVAILAVLTAVSGVSQTHPGVDWDRFIGAWRLASITGPDGTPVTTNVPNAGWPNVMSAVPVVKGVFEKRND